ncbi:MAG: hypothetical protein EOM52_10350 [Clostridia bacterium]|nr:hypothetical protein [Clostridia bacterium]
MASNQTEHLGLNQWEGSDHFLRTEFNEDNRKIDAAIAASPKIVAGSYVGTGGALEPISLGFYPMVVHIETMDGMRGYDGSHGGLVLRDYPLKKSGSVAVQMTPDGFEPRTFAMNVKDVVYYYLAIG